MRPRKRSTPRAAAAALSFLALLAACGSAPELPPMPEPATGFSARRAVLATRQMASTADPRASEAALQILRAGGGALDAAIAAQMVLALVEPQSSGIGGGALLMHWDGREVQAWDGRETAPAGVDEQLFIGPDGKPLPFMDAVVGGRAVGVPGAVRMLEAAHRVHGRLPWARLFQPAIRMAQEGFAVSPRLHALLDGDAALRHDPLARAYFYRPEGRPHAAGHVLRNPALAAILRRIAAEGSAALHEGAIATDLAARVRAHASNPGRMIEADLAAYAPRQRAPLCAHWKQTYRICGFPPPSSGQLALMQILGVLDRVPAVAQPLADGIPGPDWLHAYTEAARLAYADRAVYVADPEFVAPPAGRWTSLLDARYLDARAALIGARSMRTAPPGRPLGEPMAWAAQAAQPEHGTTHISVVDAQGQAVALTSSIEAVFGARLLADGGTGLPGGYLLNNQLTDFALEPADAQGRPVANRVQPGKRPRSSMSPTLVFDARDGRLLMTLGSPLGPAIPHLVAKTLVGTLAWGFDVQSAIDLPNFASFNGPTVLEAGGFPQATLEALRARGHTVDERELASGILAIERVPGGWRGGSDPRREGAALGD